MMEEDIERFLDEEGDEVTVDEDDGEESAGERDAEHENDNADENVASGDTNYYPDVPVVMPRSGFSGACNVETVKDGELPHSAVHGSLTFSRYSQLPGT